MSKCVGTLDSGICAQRKCYTVIVLTAFVDALSGNHTSENGIWTW